MKKSIEAKEVEISKLFSPDYIFEIPIYQRPLSWNSENFNQLFEDIEDAINNEAVQYFLGTLILQSSVEENSRYAIIDGQQRLTSLVVLLAVIRDISKNNTLRQRVYNYLYQEEDEYKNIPEEMRIIPWEDFRPIFKEYIYKLDGTLIYKNDILSGKIKYTDKNDARYHLFEAIDVFYQKCNLLTQDVLESYLKYLLNNVYMVYVKTETFDSAYKLFNVLNTRGLSLSTSDLLKSDNLSVIKNETLRNKLAHKWTEIEDMLGRDEFEYLFAFIRTIFLGEKAKLNIYEEYKKHILDKKIQTGEDFINHVINLSNMYKEKILEGFISTSNDKDNEYHNVVSLINKYIPYFDWIPPVLLFCHKFNNDNYLFNFLKKFEKKIVLEWAAGFTPTERITSFNKTIKLIHESNEANYVIENLFRVDSDETKKGRRARIINFDNKDEVKKSFHTKLNDQDFYNIYAGKFCKYLLLRIDMQLWEIENFPGYPGTITIEHILPQNPSEESEWNRNFKIEERDNWTNKIGNLVLLSGRKNSRAGNLEFNNKKKTYFSNKYTSFRITQQIDDYLKWTTAELESRQKALIKNAQDIYLSY